MKEHATWVDGLLWPENMSWTGLLDIYRRSSSSDGWFPKNLWTPSKETSLKAFCEVSYDCCPFCGDEELQSRKTIWLLGIWRALLLGLLHAFQCPGWKRFAGIFHFQKQDERALTLGCFGVIELGLRMANSQLRASKLLVSFFQDDGSFGEFCKRYDWICNFGSFGLSWKSGTNPEGFGCWLSEY